MPSSNSEIAYDHIKKCILSGEYAPGRSLATITLSEEIGVSRTPVRDALRQLEADGLVTIQTRLGARVTSMDLKAFREMCGLRLALESYAASCAAGNRGDTDLREISNALDSMRKLTAKLAASEKEEPLLGELRREDVRFHIAIISAAQNELLKKEILRLHLINRVVSSSGPREMSVTVTRSELERRRKAVLAEHEAIYRAIERRDAAAARDTMAAHIQDIIDNALRVMAQTASTGTGLSEEELSYVP